MLNGVASANLLQNCGLFILPVRRYQNRDRPADSLFGSIAKQALGAPIPSRNNAIEVFAYDRIVGRLDDRCEAQRNDLGLFAICDVARDF
jgi:hypothetical protein